MADVVQCQSCDEKIIEDDDFAMLECPHCGSGILKVIKHGDEEGK